MTPAEEWSLGNRQEREDDRRDAQRMADEAAEWAERDLADMDKLTAAAMAGRDAHNLAQIAELNARLGWANLAAMSDRGEQITGGVRL